MVRSVIAMSHLRFFRTKGFFGGALNHKCHNYCFKHQSGFGKDVNTSALAFWMVLEVIPTVFFLSLEWT